MRGDYAARLLWYLHNVWFMLSLYQTGWLAIKLPACNVSFDLLTALHFYQWRLVLNLVWVNVHLCNDALFKVQYKTIFFQKCILYRTSCFCGGWIYWYLKTVFRILKVTDFLWLSFIDNATYLFHVELKSTVFLQCFKNNANNPRYTLQLFATFWHASLVQMF